MSTKKKRIPGRPGRPSRYGPEFQRDAVAMVLDENRSGAEVARSLGVNEGTLGNWVSKERTKRVSGSEIGVDERVELSDLRRQVGELRMERDLLKRSLAFWVKESTQ